MKNKVLIISLFVFSLSNFSYSSEVDCDKFKKFSINFMKCKGNLVKDKTISAGKIFVEDTMDYQKEGWSDKKDKLNEIKQKVLKK